MARRQKAKRQRGKNVTVAVLIENAGETIHRGRTLRQALTIAAHARLRKGCSFRWSGYGPHQKWAKGLKRLPGRTAGADGEVVCDGRRTGRSAWITIYRPRAKYTGSGKAYQRRR